MAWSLRCRTPQGPLTLSGVDPDVAVKEFLKLLQERSGIPLSRLEILSGFPPKPLQLRGDSSQPLHASGLANGDMLVLREGQGLVLANGASGSDPPLPALVPTASQEDRDLALAIALSLGEAPTDISHEAPLPMEVSQTTSRAAVALEEPKQRLGGVMGAQTGPTGLGPSPTAVQLKDGQVVVRRLIDSDNSCLFNAVGYVMEKDKKKAKHLRQVIARVVAQDPAQYTEAFLGKDNAEYCEWIQRMDKWGGAIELSILSQYYQREIAAYDIQTKRCDLYGQDGGYVERVMLIYDGLHYDALAVSPFPGAPEESDITILKPGASNEVDMVLEGAQQLVAACHDARQFTDVANFTLRCSACQKGLRGEKEATEHAKATGHMNFVEY